MYAKVARAQSILLLWINIYNALTQTWSDDTIAIPLVKPLWTDLIDRFVVVTNFTLWQKTNITQSILCSLSSTYLWANKPRDLLTSFCVPHNELYKLYKWRAKTYLCRRNLVHEHRLAPKLWNCTQNTRGEKNYKVPMYDETKAVQISCIWLAWDMTQR